MTSDKARAIAVALLLLPLDVVVALSLLLTDALGVLVRAPVRTLPRSGRLRRPSATVQILNWDGKHLLDESVPAAIEAVKRVEGNHEVVVVDNGSTDGSVDFVRERYPGVRVVSLDRNYRFTGGNNRGLQTSSRDVVVFLNNDMIVDPDFLPPLLGGFRDRAVFAVTSQVFFWDKNRRREETGKTRARFENGFFRMWHDEVWDHEEHADAIPVFWGGGGSCAFDREKYIAIGGLDTLLTLSMSRTRISPTRLGKGDGNACWRLRATSFIATGPPTCRDSAKTSSITRFAATSIFSFGRT